MKKINYLNIKDCPICGEHGKQLEHTLWFYLEPLKSTVEQRYRYCPNCKWGYCENPLNEESMNQYYAELYRYLRDTLAVDRMHIANQVEFAIRYMPSHNGLKVLEIGPCQPHFLDAVTMGTKAQGYFEEMNLMAAARLEASGYIPANKVDDMPQQYDLIAMCHVFEHVINPVIFLRNLGKRLAPNGVIFTEVPDFTRLDWLAQDDFQFEHVNYFSTQSLIRLAQRAGFDLVACESTRTKNYTTCGNQVLRTVFRANERTSTKSVETTEGWNSLLARPIETMHSVRKLLSKGPEKIALYGAGTRTTELMAYCDMGELPKMLYDIDPQKVGQTLCGIQVRDPITINPDEFDRILIMVLGRENEVAEFLKGQGVAAEQIIFLSSIILSK